MKHLKSEKAIERKAILGKACSHIADIKNPENHYSFVGVSKVTGIAADYDGEVNRYKTAHPREEKRPQLFNLTKDPWRNPT